MEDLNQAPLQEKHVVSLMEQQPIKGFKEQVLLVHSRLQTIIGFRNLDRVMVVEWFFPAKSQTFSKSTSRQ